MMKLKKFHNKNLDNLVHKILNQHQKLDLTKNIQTNLNFVYMLSFINHLESKKTFRRMNSKIKAR